MQFEGVGALRAKMPARDRRLRIALDRNQLSVLVIGQLPAPDAAIRTNGTRHFRVGNFGPKLASALAHGFRARTTCSCLNLPDHRPSGEKLFQQGCAPLAKLRREIAAGPCLILISRSGVVHTVFRVRCGAPFAKSVRVIALATLRYRKIPSVTTQVD